MYACIYLRVSFMLGMVLVLYRYMLRTCVMQCVDAFFDV